MTAGPSTVPGLGRRTPQAFLLWALLGLSALAWAVTHTMADDESRLGILTGAGRGHALHGHHGGGGTGFHPAAGTVFVAMWVVMAVAMMLPTALPVLGIFDRWARHNGKPRRLTLALAAGYLSTWSACGLAAYGSLLALQAVLPSGDDGVIRAGAVLLVGAGAYQFSAMKEACLSHCRSPVSVVAQYAGQLHQGARGPWSVGVRHGLYCVGCCWSLMGVLLLVGMMSTLWMGLLAAVMFAEKVAPWGGALARVVGAVLVLTGVVLLVHPVALPAGG